MSDAYAIVQLGSVDIVVLVVEAVGREVVEVETDESDIPPDKLHAT